MGATIYVMAVLLIISVRVAWSKVGEVISLRKEVEYQKSRCLEWEVLVAKKHSDLVFEKSSNTRLVGKYQSQLQSAQAEIRALESKLLEQKPVATVEAMTNERYVQRIYLNQPLPEGTKLFTGAVPAVAAKQSQNDSIAVLEEWCDKLLAEFPLLDDEGLCQEKHHCEWTLQQDRKRLHTLLQSAPTGEPK